MLLCAYSSYRKVMEKVYKEKEIHTKHLTKILETNKNLWMVVHYDFLLKIRACSEGTNYNHLQEIILERQDGGKLSTSKRSLAL